MKNIEIKQFLFFTIFVLFFHVAPRLYTKPNFFEMGFTQFLYGSKGQSIWCPVEKKLPYIHYTSFFHPTTIRLERPCVKSHLGSSQF